MKFIGRRTLAIDLVDESVRIRPIDPVWVEGLAALMEADGQQTPLWVRHAEGLQPRRLIAGGHRIAAARHLGWKDIEVEEIDCSDAEAELLEIDENIARSELSELERAIFLGRRKAVYEELHPETKHGGERRPEQVANLATCAIRFTADAAKRLKLSERTVQRAIRRYERLDPEVASRLATSPIANKGTEIDALCDLEPEGQREVVNLLLRVEKPARSVTEARAELSGAPQQQRSPSEVQFEALIKAWGKADKRVRKRFIDHLVKSGALDKGELA